jgi:hypothetical protein
VVAVYFLGDISAHINPVTTLAFALRKDMDWITASTYWTVQFATAICGSLLARAFFGPTGNLAATMPKPGQSWQAAGFEAIMTFGPVLMVLMVLNLANGPKLNGPFVPLAVGSYIMAWGTMGGPYDGTSMNPARSFGPDAAFGDLSTWWVYPDRALGRRRHRRGSRADPARAGPSPGSQRRPGRAAGPGSLTRPRGRRPGFAPDANCSRPAAAGNVRSQPASGLRAHADRTHTPADTRPHHHGSVG